MKMRKPLSNRKSKKLWKRTVKKTSPINIAPPPMRGGIRI